MGTYCATFLQICFCFFMSLTNNSQADVVEAFNSASRYIDILLNTENPFFPKNG